MNMFWWLVVLVSFFFVLWFKRGILKDKIEYEMEFHKKKQEGYREEKLKLAHNIGRQQARKENGFKPKMTLNNKDTQEDGLENLRRMIYNEPKKKKKKKIILYEL